MIEVTVTTNEGELELGRIHVERVRGTDESGDYSVRFGVDRCGAVGMHSRTFHNFPRTKYNVLGLLYQALSTLDPKELELEDETSASDLARRRSGTLPEIQGG